MRSASTADRAGLAPVSVRRLVAFIGWVAAAACSGGGPTEPAGPPAALAKSDGDGQSWYFNNPLPVAYQVVVRDAGGRPVPGVSVSWAVTAGGGSVDPSVSTTDGDGHASATHTLGPSATSHTVTANAAGLPEVAFSASAASPPNSAAVTLTIQNRFTPQSVVVQAAGTVTWTWAPNQIEQHNVIFAVGPAGRPPDSPTQMAGSYSAVFNQAGVFDYFCNIHANMTGRVRVVN
jgi:plastocyanin